MPILCKDSKFGGQLHETLTSCNVFFSLGSGERTSLQSCQISKLLMICNFKFNWCLNTYYMILGVEPKKMSRKVYVNVLKVQEVMVKFN